MTAKQSHSLTLCVYGFEAAVSISPFATLGTNESCFAISPPRFLCLGFLFLSLPSSSCYASCCCASLRVFFFPSPHSKLSLLLRAAAAATSMIAFFMLCRSSVCAISLFRTNTLVLMPGKIEFLLLPFFAGWLR